MSESKKNSGAQEQQDVRCLMQVHLNKLNELEIADKDPFEITTYEQSHHTAGIKTRSDELRGTEVSVVDRVTSKRVMGKASFCAVRGLSGDTQIHVARDVVGEEAYVQFEGYDIGDIIGVRGKMFETKTGEISIRAEELTLLTKSIQPLPEKFHGLTGTDRCYRQRYIDLVMDPEVRETFVKRFKIIFSIRRYLDDRGFMEVEIPMLVSNVGGAAARLFETHYNTLSEDVELCISLEFYLKRPIVGGLEYVYEIRRMSRNESLDARHSPEFTLMEFYQMYTDYGGMMSLTEDMFRHVAREVNDSAKITYSSTEIGLEKSSRRITMTGAIKEYSGADLATIETLEEARAVVKERGVAPEERHQRGDILNLFFETFYGEHMIRPTFVTDHPVEIPSFMEKKPSNPDYMEHFEPFIYGRGVCNAYPELNDPVDQRERFKAQDTPAAAGDEKANHTDEDFLDVLDVGIPPTGGIGYGINRLVVLLTDSPAVRDVLLFPIMKAMKAENKEAHGEGESKAEEASGFFTPNEKIDSGGVKIESLFEDQVDFETFSESGFCAAKAKGCRAVPKSEKLLRFALGDGTGTRHTILGGIHAYYEPEELIGKTLIAIMNLSPRSVMDIESCSMLFSAINKHDGEEELYLLMVDNHIPTGAKLYQKMEN